MTINQPIHYAAIAHSETGTGTYEELLLPHLQLLTKWVNGRTPKGLHPEDVVQETLLLALRHIKKFRFEASVGTWLCKIALNVIRGRLRRLTSSSVVFEDPLKLECFEARDPRRSPLDALEQKEADIALHRAIANLPDIYRVVIELRNLRGLSARETMRILAISETALKSRHYRARGLLRDLLLQVKAEKRAER